MIKQKLGIKTYCYDEFITIEEQSEIKKWALDNENKMPANMSGPYRRFSRLDNFNSIPNIIHTIKQRVIDVENIKNVMEAPQNADWIGIQWESAFVEPHLDDNGNNKNYYTRRYNILISYPEEGGQPIYGNEILEVKERMMWRCDAGLIEHSSIQNKGKIPRINLSFGFLMPIKDTTKKSLL